MYIGFMKCLVFLSVLVKLSSQTSTDSYRGCNEKSRCIPLKDCDNLMEYIQNQQKPLKSSSVEFLRRQHCGFHEGHPKVCCSGFSEIHISHKEPSSAGNSSCRAKTNCIPLKDCRPYVDLVKSMEKPLKPPVVDFFRSQQCGFQEGYPKVCCSQLPKEFGNVKHARPESRPSVKIPREELLVDDDISRLEPTNKRGVDKATTVKPEWKQTSSTMSLKEKSEALNRAFAMSELFDFTGPYDLFRRKRFNNDSVLEVEANDLLRVINSPRYVCHPPRGNICVKARQCRFFDDLLNRTAKPRPPFVIDLIREYQCGFDGVTPYVCCQEPSPTLPPETTKVIKTTPRVKFSILTRTIAGHKNVNLLPNDICGPVSTDSRITYGTRTAIGEFPWMALIAYYEHEVLDFKCGGTVINERYVLTAAHCILPSSIVGVRLGEHNLDTMIDCDLDEENCAPPPQDFYIENFKIHPNYNSTIYSNDIALIRLATPANFSSFTVKPICLPMGEMDLKGRSAIVSGWGVTETGFRSKELLKVSLPVLPVSKCQSNYNNFAIVTEKQVCAGGYNGKDSCGGDSGGPMQYAVVINGTARFIQYGIVSYGARYCGMSGQPSVYTKVPEYMTWILDNLEPSLDD
ncbi:hypothetical protein NQ318_004035 [Aromia moschata]|uniref:CLIP domain-containing serine protease n=1 Tax=Aromia moschata TaxID=1265417 RepID=A0AAV8Z8V3_9CUCU|nr:hypothetical protein NQ318_004035 [Aromia moschata]